MKQIFFIFLVAPLSVFCMEQHQWNNSLINIWAQFSAKGYRTSLDTFHEISGSDYIVYQKGDNPRIVEKPPLKKIQYILYMHSPALKSIDDMITANEAYLNGLDDQIKRIVFSILTMNIFMPSKEEKKLLKRFITDPSINWYLKQNITRHKATIKKQCPSRSSQLSQVKNTLRNTLTRKKDKDN